MGGSEHTEPPGARSRIGILLVVYAMLSLVVWRSEIQACCRAGPSCLALVVIGAGSVRVVYDLAVQRGAGAMGQNGRIITASCVLGCRSSCCFSTQCRMRDDTSHGRSATPHKKGVKNRGRDFTVVSVHGRLARCRQQPVRLDEPLSAAFRWSLSVCDRRGTGNPCRTWSKRELAADLSVQFTKAADAANRAVMADTDEASSHLAGEAATASDAVQRDLDTLGPVLRDPGYSNETRLLAEFRVRFSNILRSTDHPDLAVENTNLRLNDSRSAPRRKPPTRSGTLSRLWRLLMRSSRTGASERSSRQPWPRCASFQVAGATHC
jgi:hypothetical protein